MASEEFIYRPLSSPTSIRLISIKPLSSQSEASRIEGTIIETKLEEVPPYEALSYTWGDGVRSETAWINGQCTKITHSLWNFLFHIRYFSTFRLVWVDALCISQTDMQEKSRQVSMIARIFSSAERVLAWVGERSDDSDLIFARDWTVRNPLPITTYRKFMDRNYWMRTWIIQELVMAKSIVVHCGPDRMSWETMLKDLNPMYNQGYRLIVERKRYGPNERKWQQAYDWTIGRIESRIHEYRRIRSGSPLDTAEFVRMIWNFRQWSCSDARDKVFALLSLYDSRPVIQPDYTLTRAELFIKLCTTHSRYCLDHAILFDLLNLTSSRSSRDILDVLIKVSTPLDINYGDYKPFARILNAIRRLNFHCWDDNSELPDIRADALSLRRSFTPVELDEGHCEEGPSDDRCGKVQ